jgi:response regulator NasT
MDPSLKIAIVASAPERAGILREGLRAAGFSRVVPIENTAALAQRIAAEAPDAILIDLGNPGRDALERMLQVCRAVPRPIAMFVDQSDSASVAAAVDAGVAAFIVGGLRQERIGSIVELSVARFNALKRLQGELERARAALEERKLIDRAKGLLMKAKNLTEAEAYALLRKTAMNENKKIAEIAQSVITAAELLR